MIICRCSVLLLGFSVLIRGRRNIFWFLHQTTTSVTIGSFTCMLYIFWFLHQTTTDFRFQSFLLSCISFDSYIKPQREIHDTTIGNSCISFDSYIKPQLHVLAELIVVVVYLLIPTSNHNFDYSSAAAGVLYIFWFLHQTTTLRGRPYIGASCISFDSYIKPQLRSWKTRWRSVVYLLIPTSNHNSLQCLDDTGRVVYLLIPTSNHNHRRFDDEIY